MNLTQQCTLAIYKELATDYNLVLATNGVAPVQCLMIGDSIMNDIVGAKKSGMNVCFYNPKHKNISDNILYDFEIYSLAELKRILQK